MSGVYESIVAGLNEAIEDAKSTENKLKRRVVTVMPVKEFLTRRWKLGRLESIILPVLPAAC